MAENQHLAIARRPHVWVFALAAAGLAACAPSHSAPTAQAPTLTPVISTATPAPAPQLTAAPPTVTVTAPPPVTVTVDAPAPATPVGYEVAASGPFQSPSGNIQCTMYVGTDGSTNANCAAANHDWVATQPTNCQAAWGDRVDLEAGAPARFGCYGQEMPAPTHTLEYGQIQKLGSISCASETVGIMCIDNDSGHYFFVSRQTVNLG